MTVVFAGTIGRCVGLGGLAWMNMQYLAGLRELGHDVVYLEDCGEGSWVYHWEREEITTDLDYPAGYVRECLEPLGLGDRWLYRSDAGSRGIPVAEAAEACAEAELLLVHAQPLHIWRPEYDLPARRAFVDVDPGFTQIALASGTSDLAETLSHCETLFTIAQRIGAPDCAIPDAGREWVPTLPPVALTHWPVAAGEEPSHFTAVMHWRGHREVEWEGVRYGQKDVEFPKFLDLPRLTQQPLLVALTGTGPERLERHGWDVVPGWMPSRTPWSYRDFIRGSRAELGVAKHGYVAMRGGWFSDRSVCYLASGRPVLVEDTGAGDVVPTGEGIVTFRDVREARAGIERINGDYDRHRRAARRIAEERFAADVVLPRLLEAALA